MTVAEFWTVSCGFGVEDKKTLGEKLREALEENKELKQQLDKLKDRLTYTALKNMDANIKYLQQQLDSSRERFRSMNSSLNCKLSSSMHQVQELKTQLKQKEDDNTALHSLVDSFIDKCNGLEAKAEGYKKELDEKIELLNAVQDRFTKADLKAQLEDLTQRYENAMLSLKIVNERLDKAIADRSELQVDRDIWFRKNGERQAEIEELKKKISLLEADLKNKGYSRDAWRIEAERLRKEITESYSDGYSDGNEEGQNELWEMLQLINDVKPFEAPYFEDVTGMNDIISWDLEDFKEAYDKWETEQKKPAEEAKKQHVEYMRDYLKRYCRGIMCINCPLHNISEPVTSCSFSRLTDEEIEKKYRKVVDSEWEKAPRYFRSTIETVFTAEAKINKDLLKDICGIKPKEEEHKLEYGDTVRLPWRDHDYMYIGPDEKEETLVRLFDPENHAIVTTHIANVKYNGGRILVAEEDDIRKIWKYMK